MKIFKSLILLLSTSLVYAQQSGTAIYGKEWLDPYTQTEKGQELKESDPKLYKEYLQTEQVQSKLTKQLNFSLEFNKDEGLFTMDEIMGVDDNPMMGLATGPYQGNYYQNNSSNEVVWQLKSFDGMYLIALSPIEWKLENKQKTINRYKCYKAKGNQMTYKKGDEVKTAVIAWYAPDIPFKFGPIGFNGLPGMILSLTTRGEHYFLKNIEFSKDEKMIEKPSDGKKMTYLEFVGIFDEKVDKIRP
ncbi:GLPGLI family protein [Salegentibacter sp. Hel_I_6]|uniref:GLPGLI family protein n=1 Tax=Salegentibacter sp. Hel_I_6 TaxID=1250278 RepID=UPI000567E41E|nr:GLPGLI family protein [Salegentibacter sp. Hel_I_6]